VSAPTPFPGSRFGGLLLLYGLSLTAHGNTELNIPGYRLIWHDEFEADAVDASKWDVATGVNAWYQRASDGRFVEPQWFNEPFAPWIQAGTINGERQYDSPNNVSVSNGVLNIEARQVPDSSPASLLCPDLQFVEVGGVEFAHEVGAVELDGALAE